MQKLFHVILVAAILLHPTLAVAAEPASPSMMVDDVIAGFETGVELMNLAPLQSFDLHVISPSGEDTSISVRADNTGRAETLIPARLTAEAGTYRAFAVAGQTKLTDDVIFDVLSNRVDPLRSTVTVASPFLAADGSSTTTVTVTLNDMHGNPLAERPVQLIGNRTQDVITPLTASRETDGSGRVQFAIQTGTPGEIALRAMDLLSGTVLQQVAQILARGSQLPVGGFAATQNNFSAQLINSAEAAPSYDVVNRFVVKTSVQTIKVRDVIPNLEIIAVDANGKTVESYTGNIRITTPDDPNSTLPGLPPDQGKAVFSPKARGDLNIPWSVSFSKSGPEQKQRIVVADESGTIRGETTVTVMGTAVIDESRRIRLESPKDGETVNNREILLKGKGPALSNLVVWIKDASTPPESLTLGEPVAEGETESDGTFAFTATIPAGSTDVVIDVQDADGKYDSGPVSVTLDTRGPAVQLTFDPPQPQEGETVMLSAESEPNLPEVVLHIDGRDLSLTEDTPGTYRLSFQTPPRSGSDYTLSARDAAGNVTDTDGTLGVTGPMIPQVQNLQAQSLAGGIQLLWDMIPDESITAYRIDVKSPSLEQPITLDTPEATDSAAVMGLKAGADYSITVRALRNDELGPRSSAIVAQTLGMELAVAPQEGGLLLQWTFPDSTPLSAFLLEYGSPEGEYSEQRRLDGAMRAYTVNDLLAQPYLIRLTPVATTGEILSDLMVTGEGTPLTALAFRPSGGDVRVNPDVLAPGDGLHSGAPMTPGSGLPGLSWKFILGLTMIPAAWYWYRRRKGLKHAREFMQGMEKRYYS